MTKIKAKKMKKMNQIIQKTIMKNKMITKQSNKMREAWKTVKNQK